jgi:hypothetical protein
MSNSRKHLLPLYFLLPILLTATSVLAVEVAPGQTRQFNQASYDCILTPFEETIKKATGADCDVPFRVESYAILSLAAINNDVSAQALQKTPFSVSGDNGSVLDASVSASANWQGFLFGAGIVGAGANVQITLELYDETDQIATGQITVFTKSQDSASLKGIDIGGTRVSGSRVLSFSGTVKRGHDYTIRYAVTCNAESGFVGIDVGCVFFTDLTGYGLSEDLRAELTQLSITIEGDVFERLDVIDEKLDEMDEKLDGLDSKLSGVDQKTDEILRLLMTPPGRRETEGDSFPKKP